MQRLSIHPINPQERLILQVIECLNQGGLIVMPTDATYVFACRFDARDAIENLCAIRHLDKQHRFTLACSDLSALGHYANVNNTQFRLIKANTPGPYTFILNATKEVPKPIQHPKRKTIGLRVIDHAVVQMLLEKLQLPLLISTMLLPKSDAPIQDPEDIAETLGKRIDLLIDVGTLTKTPTTVVDLTKEVPMLVRAGSGDTSPFEH